MYRSESRARMCGTHDDRAARGACIFVLFVCLFILFFVFHTLSFFFFFAERSDHYRMLCSKLYNANEVE